MCDITSHTILIIDDEDSIRCSFSDYLEDRNYRVLTAENGRVGIDLMLRENPSLVLTDLRMPEVDGLDVLKHGKRHAPDTPIVVVSGTGRISDAIEATRLGAWDYLMKPITDMSVLEHTVNNAIEKSRLRRENKAYQESLQRLVEERTAGLRKSEKRMELALRGADLGTWDWNVQTDEVVFNERWAGMLGYTLDEINPHLSTWKELVHHDDLPGVMKSLEANLQGERTSFETEHRLRHKSGEWVWVLNRGRVIERDADGIPLRACGTHLDITDRKRADEARTGHMQFLEDLGRVDQAIRDSVCLDHMLGKVLDTVLDIFQCDRVWLLHPCDPDAPSFQVPMESTRPEYPGVKALDLAIPITPSMKGDIVDALASEGPVACGPGNEKPQSADTHHLFGVQSQMFMSLHPKTGSAWMFGMHQCSGVRVWTDQEKKLFNEIGRRTADGLTSMLFLRDLEESERQYRLLAENVTDVIWTMDLDLCFTYFSPSILQLRGYTVEETLAQPLSDILAPESSTAVQQLLKNQLKIIENGDPEGWSPISFDAEFRCKNGTNIITSNSIKILGDSNEKPTLILGVTHDITDRKRAERERSDLEVQLRQSQKLEAVGQLAGGVAHDFNNILTAILGNVELSMDSVVSELGSDHLVAMAMEQIEAAALRASALTRQLLTFSRRDVAQPEALNINVVLDNLDSMLRRLITEDIALTTETDSKLKLVRADAGQLEQVIVNLVVNATHAMPDGGRLTLETKNVHLDDDYTSSHAEAHPGEHVLLAVSDTGHGMDATTIERIFEPFFTTKPVDKGTGLGLSTVHGIVKQSGGHIMVYSEPGHGTTFKVYLPIIDRDDLNHSSMTIPAADHAGDETVLLCEDDRPVRELIAQSLETAGYTVITAGNGREGILAAEQHTGSIDLLITDVIMPDMNGRALAEQLHKANPSLPTLFISGYTSNVIAHHGVLDQGVEFLEKPFTKQRLLKKVRSVLARAKMKT